MHPHDDYLGAVSLAELYEDLSEGRVQALRRDFGLTQSDIARTIGASRSAVASWEDGRRRPRGVLAARYKSLCASLIELSSRQVPGSKKIEDQPS
jgi:DNA-binding XRE family transcriptional regulator